MNSLWIRTDGLSKTFLRRSRPPTVINSLRESFAGRPNYPEVRAVDALTISVNRGDRVAVIGSNGSGKTTLLRLVAGILRPTSGAKEVLGKPCALFRFSIGLSDKHSLRDNLLLFAGINGIPMKEFKEALPRVLEFAELSESIDRPLKDLSSGQFQRIALSAFMEVTNEFLLFDETFSFVDDAFLQRCLTKLDAWLLEKTLLMTSHDQAIIHRYCDKALWLERGKLMDFGEIGPVMEAYQVLSQRSR